MDWKASEHGLRGNWRIGAGGRSTLTGAGDPGRACSGGPTTASLVDVFGVRPALGRWYTEQEDQFGGPLVVVLSHDFWTRRFNADPSISAGV